MNPAVSGTFNFADFQGFAALRRDAVADTPDALLTVARQFEALFLQQLLAQMRQASPVAEGEGLLGSERMDGYQSMHDQQLALSLAQGGGIGLAESILRQLGDTTTAQVSSRTPALTGRRAADVAGPPSRTAALSAPAAAAGFAETPEEFVAAVRPHAQRAAARLGVPADALIAQAALETGWGRFPITREDGRDSFNLFGIKATPQWRGDTVRRATLEFVDGVPERRREAFRAYPDLARGFADYADVVADSPRYREALEADDAAGYLRGLQAGGYATDPHYADKILAILERGLPETAPGPFRAAQVSPAPADNGADGTAVALAAGLRGFMP